MNERILLLLRHAKAAAGAPGIADGERALTERGRRAALAVGREMARRHLQPRRVLCSSARRTLETWSIARQALDAAPEVEVSPSLYLATAQALLQRIAAVPDSDRTLLLVGHNPGIEDLARQLGGRHSAGAALARLRQKFPTGGLAIFGSAAPWVALTTDACRLIDFVTPADLGVQRHP